MRSFVAAVTQIKLSGISKDECEAWLKHVVKSDLRVLEGCEEVFVCYWTCI